MQDSLFPTEIPVEELLSKHGEWSGMADQGWWNSACAALATYQPPAKSLTIKNKDRKWELVSGFQKAIRRGDKALALRMASAMFSLPEEHAYFWKRIATVSAEDVGAGSPEVMNFVISCYATYTPKKAGDQLYPIWCFLAEMMCEADKSHAYCTMDILGGQWPSIKPKDLTEQEEKVLWTLKKLKKSEDKTEWAIRNDWRGEGMVRYQLHDGGLTLEKTSPEIPPTKIIKGLPSYAYDQHTRAGKKVCAMLTGFQIVKSYLADNPTAADKAQIVGDAIFYLEGALIRDEYRNEMLSALEQKFAAAGFGWSYIQWTGLKQVVAQLIADGAVDQLREKVLNQLYP